MVLTRVVALAALVVVVPTAASAEAPWSAPSPVDGVSSTTTLLTTQIGGTILVGTSSTRSLASPTVVARVHADGSTAGRQTLAIAYAKAAGYERAGVVVAGSRPAQTTRGAERAPVLVARGSIRGSHGVGAPVALPGSAGQWVTSVGGNPANHVIAVVTASMYNRGAPTRTLWLRRGGAFRRVLTIRPGTNARDTSVAVGPRGDVLFAWQGHRAVYAQHFGPAGRPGAVHRLGAGVQSALQTRIDDDGRLEVAWESQRIGEGYAGTPSVVSYTSAAPGKAFARALVVGGTSPTGTGRYVMRPGVRLVAAGPNASVLAWTDYDGKHYRVQVADVAGGTIAAPQTVSAADDDGVLGDLAASPAGGLLVLWLTGTGGHDPTGPQRVAAAVRPPGAPAFGAPEFAGEPTGQPGPGSNATVAPFAPSAALDARARRGFAVWTTIQGQTKVASRAR